MRGEPHPTGGVRAEHSEEDDGGPRKGGHLGPGSELNKAGSRNLRKEREEGGQVEGGRGEEVY